MDYQEVGFKAGLEIHQQLDTHKLFCSCPSIITEDIDYSFTRKLRPTQSEMGDIDKAALAEAQRKRHFLYTASHTSTCLVEADEEPPHQPNPEAIDICLIMTQLLNAQPVDEIRFMRKLVIDGSNTSGFQRTALIGTNGSLEGVTINTLALEEDSARKIQEKGKLVNYGLDRLGIPLIEITTGPQIKNPDHAHQVAKRIGQLLRATKKVKRGLGTIRQDLNISIQGGARVEIKGIQSLSSISRVAEKEVTRQQGIIQAKKTLCSRTTKEAITAQEPIEITTLLAKTQSQLIQNQLKKKNTCILAMILPGFRGLLKQPDTRIGKELAVYARLAAGIGGILHSDELPGYGITPEEVASIETQLQLTNTKEDAIVMAIGEEKIITAAFEAIKIRAQLLLDGVIEAVRRSLPDDTTEYMRPLPGSARMYPETDIPPQLITQEHLQHLQIPELPEEKLKRFIKEYGLSKQHAEQLLNSGFEDDFETLTTQYPNHQKVIIRTLLHTFAELENEEIALENITQVMLHQIFEGLNEDKYAKEAIPQLLTYMIQHPKDKLEEAIKKCGLETVDEATIRTTLHTILEERKDYIKRKGKAALGPLMGPVMEELRGKADGKLISRLLAEEIEKILNE